MRGIEEPRPPSFRRLEKKEVPESEKREAAFFQSSVLALVSVSGTLTIGRVSVAFMHACTRVEVKTQGFHRRSFLGFLGAKDFLVLLKSIKDALAPDPRRKGNTQKRFPSKILEQSD